jgi:hypothetical protein
MYSGTAHKLNHTHKTQISFCVTLTQKEFWDRSTIMIISLILRTLVTTKAELCFMRVESTRDQIDSSSSSARTIGTLYLSENSDDTLTSTFNEGFFPTLSAHNVLGKGAVSVHDLIASPPPT